MVFTETAPEQKVWQSALVHGQFVIPSGAANHRIDASMTFTEDVHLLSLLPHSHLRGTRWDYQAVYPDGTTEAILSVPRYDFNWQIDYMFSEPLTLPKGSRIEATAYYDNSAANRSNPDPTAEVRWGAQTYEEMMFTALSFLVDGETSATETTQQQQ